MPGESIKFVADVSEVRQALDRVVSDAARMRVAIPVGSAPGAAGAIAAGFPPTVSGIFGSSFTDVYGRFGAGVGPLFNGGQGAPLGGNFNSFPATGGFSGRPNFNYNAGGAPTVGGTLGTPTAAGGPPGGFPSPAQAVASGFPGQATGGSFDGGFATRGFGRFVGAGYLAHIGFSEAEAARQNNIDTILAGGDQGAQLAATMRYRDRVTAAGGWIGQAVSFLQDPTGEQEAGITAQTRAATAQDASAAARSRGTEFGRRLSDEAALSGITDPIAKRREAERQAHDERMEQINKEIREQDKFDNNAIDAVKARQAADRSRDIQSLRDRGLTRAELGMAPGETDFDSGTERLGDIVDRRNAATIASMRGEAARRRAGQLLGWTGAENTRTANDAAETDREEGRMISARGFGLSQAILADTSEMRAAGMEAAGNTLGAARERITSRARARLAAANRDAFGPASTVNAVLASLGAAAEDAALDGGNARDVGNAISDVDARRDAALSRLGRDPLGARIRELRASRDEALRSPLGIFSADYRASVNREFEDQRAATGLADADARLEHTRSIEARGRVLEAQRGGGRFGPILGESAAINERAIEAVKRINDDPRSDKADAAKELRNAQLEQQLLTDRYRSTFRGGDESFGTIRGISGGQQTFGNGDVKKVLDSIDRNIATLVAAQKAQGDQFGVR